MSWSLFMLRRVPPRPHTLRVTSSISALASQATPLPQQAQRLISRSGTRMAASTGTPNTGTAGGKVGLRPPDEVISGDETISTSASSAPTAPGAAAEAKATVPVQEELWVIGRVLDGFDERLGAKQEAIRQREMSIIERYASLISTLNDGLEVRDGDEFIEWLDSQQLSTPSTPSGTTDGESSKDENSDGAKERARVERFLADAEARLNALIIHKEDMLFRDRGEPKGEEGITPEAGASVLEGNISRPKLPEDELYQIRLAAHRAVLCNCLVLMSASLRRQHLKPGLTAEEAAAAARSAYLANPEDRLRTMFGLFDLHLDGYLDAASVERAVDAAVLPVTAAAERCYAAAARSVLDKKAGSAMPATMKYTLWDVLEIPDKRRCAFAWAEERKQVGPDEWRISWEQFKPSRRQYFPELDAMASNYVEEYRKRRSAWHNTRKARRRAVVYGLGMELRRFSVGFSLPFLCLLAIYPSMCLFISLYLFPTKLRSPKWP